MAGALHLDAYRQFVANLVRARHEAQLSQAKLAILLNKPPSFVAKYELCERRLDLVEALVILKALKVDSHDFIVRTQSDLPNHL
jgi:transcriptional regulator with XRE-family HTH domain